MRGLRATIDPDPAQLAARGSAGVTDPRSIPDHVRAFAALEHPASIRGQQEFFSSVLPEAEATLARAMRDEFSMLELQRLRDFLTNILPEDDDDETIDWHATSEATP